MLKKIAFLTLFIFIAISLAIWSPWEGYDLSFARFFGIEEVKKISGIELYSLKDEIELYVDDEFKGNITPEGGVLEIPGIEPGSHVVRIQRKSDPPNAYHQIIKSVNFIEGLNVVAAYELGPTEQFSQGHILYARKSNRQSESISANLNITSSTSDVEVFLDDKSFGNVPLENHSLNLDHVYNVRLQKAGFENLEFKLLPEQQEDRDRLKDLDLFIEADLFLIPIEISKE